MADQRRAALKAELRREIDASSRLLVHTKSSIHKSSVFPGGDRPVPVANAPGQFRENSNFSAAAPAGSTGAPSVTGRTQSPRRSEPFMRQFHSNGAINCLRGVPVEVQAPVSPKRRPGSPLLARRTDSPSFAGIPRTDSVVSTTASPAPATPPAAAAGIPSANSNGNDNKETLKLDRAGPVARSAFEHHSSIIFPDPNGEVAPNRLYTRKPLSNGSRTLPIKKQFPELRSSSPALAAGGSRSDSVAATDGAGSNTPRRSDSPGGRRRIDRSDNLSGTGAAVVREQPVKISGRQHDSRCNSPARAPYFENAIDNGPQAIGTPRTVGLLGYGPTGKDYSNRPRDHPRLLDEDAGVTGPEPCTRGVRRVDGRSNAPADVISTDLPAHIPDREAKFRPSVVVLHGPPAFVPPPPPARTQSPRRGSTRGADSDIFNVAAAPRDAPATPTRFGRGVGMYSPARQERPF